MTPPACPRCGFPMWPDVDLAARATNAYAAIRDRKLAVPDAAMLNLAHVARALRCRAKLCGGSSRGRR